MAGIMTHVGLLDGGTLTPAARQSFVDETIGLLENGTSDFLFGGLPVDLQFQGNPALAEGFKRDSIDEHQAAFPRFHQVWLDEMYQQIAIQFDVPCGVGSLKPAFIDPTVLFPDLKLKVGVGLPDLLVPPTPALVSIFDLDAAAALQFPLDLTAKLPTVVAELPPLPPIPPLPPVVIPPLPPVPELNVDIDAAVKFNASLNLPTIPPFPSLDILPLPAPYLLFHNCVMIVGIPLIIGLLIAEGPNFPIALADSFPIGIILLVLGVVLAAIGTCLGVKLSGQLLSFVAAFLVFLKKLILMLIVLIVGLLLGQGLISKLVASGIGLV